MAKTKPGTVIDVHEYRAELREVGRLLQSLPDSRPDQRLSTALSVPVERTRNPVPREVNTGPRAGRIAVAVGQILVWYLHGTPVTRPRHTGPHAELFPDLFALYWLLLKRNVQLDVRPAVDLVNLEPISSPAVP